MDYQVQLNNGQVIKLTKATFDVVEFTNTLNDHKTSFVNIGGAIINKHIIVSIIPLEAEVKPTVQEEPKENA